MPNLKRVALAFTILVVVVAMVLMIAVDDSVRRGKGWISSEWQNRHVAELAYGYEPAGDSVPKYLKVVPRRAITGLLVLPEIVPGGNPTHFEESVLHGRAAGNGIMTLYARVGDRHHDMLLGDTTMSALDRIIQTVLDEHRIPRSNVIVGGLSLAGTLSVKYAQYCASGNCQDGFRVAGVFGGPPETHRAAYENIAPYSRSAEDGGNAKLLADTAIRLYTEPDVLWWMETRFLDYYDMNAVDAAAFVNQLKQLGNSRAELVVTNGRGYRWGGDRHPHSWGILEPAAAVAWMAELFAEPSPSHVRPHAPSGSG